MPSEVKQKVIDQVKDLYLQGLFGSEIANELGISKNTVQYILYQKLLIQRLNPRNKRKNRIVEEYPKHKIDRVIVLTNFGYSAKEIAEDQKIPENQIIRIVLQAKQKGLIQKKV